MGYARRAARCAALLVLCCTALLAGCASSPALSPPAPMSPSAPHAVPAPPAPSDSGWRSSAPGVEVRDMQVPSGDPAVLAAVTAVRLDPAQVRFRVGYDSITPHLIAAWCATPGVVVAVNGGFFNSDYHATALVIRGGVASGTSYQGQGGMFAVDSAGQVALRHLASAPYAPGESLTEALQGWPMLVAGGQAVYANPDNTEGARRTVLARDRSGRVLLLVFATSHFALHDLPPWLLASDMDIDSAVNLDGGSSSALCVRGDASVLLEAYTPLPLVLLVEPRS